MEKFTTIQSMLAVASGLLAGCAMAVQPAANGKLASQCTHPLQASIVSFGVGLVSLLVIAGILRVGLPEFEKLASVPAWAWCGGVLGTFMVTTSLLVAPSIGATRWIALVLAGQIALSLLIDQFGWLGYPVQSVTTQRVLGIALVALGVYLVMQPTAE